MSKYTRRSQQQWQQLIEAQQSSELSQKAYCQQEGLSIGSFSNWKHKLKEEDSPVVLPEESSWLELPAAMSADKAWHIELDLGNGICLRLSQTS